MEKKIRKYLKKNILIFVLLLMLFVLFRLPYGEFKDRAIADAARRAGIEVSLSGSSLLLPLGLELENSSFSGTSAAGSFRIPPLDKVGVRINLLSLFSAPRKGSFYLKRGGEGKGSFSIDGRALKLDVNAASINMDGLRLSDEVSIKGGVVSLNGSLAVEKSYLDGSVNLSFSAEDLLLLGISPFMKELLLKNLEGTVEKVGEELQFKRIILALDGLTIKGNGSMKLVKNIMKSGIDFTARADLGDIEEGSLKGYAGFIRAFTEGANEADVKIGGTLERPRFSVNGRAIN